MHQQLKRIATQPTESLCKSVSCKFVFVFIKRSFVELYWNGSAIFTRDEKFKQPVYIKFCAKLGKWDPWKSLSNFWRTFFLITGSCVVHSSQRRSRAGSRWRAYRKPISSKTTVKYMYKKIDPIHKYLHQTMLSKMIIIAFRVSQEILTGNLNLYFNNAKFSPTHWLGSLVTFKSGLVCQM